MRVAGDQIQYAPSKQLASSSMARAGTTGLGSSIIHEVTPSI
jgi:hypothetical protein